MAVKTITLDDIIEDPRMRNICNNAATYGVSAAVIGYHLSIEKSDKGFYIVAGLGAFPDITQISPQDIEENWERNHSLFYPHMYAREITGDNFDTVVSDFNEYCQNVEVLNALYRQYGCEVPEVMRRGEVTNLIELNAEVENENRSWTVRSCYEKELERFFKEEKKIEKSKSFKETMQFYRSDRSDGHPKNKRRNFKYYKLAGKQEIPLERLQGTGTEILQIHVPENVYQDMKKTLELTPYVMYSAGDLRTYDMGHIEGGVDPWKDEQRYFESRVLYYKKVDEPEMASAYIRSVYSRMDTMDSIARNTREASLTNNSIPVARYVPERYMDAFYQVAKQVGMHFTFDYNGVLLKPSFEKIPVLVSRSDEGTLASILTYLDNKAFEEHDTTPRNMQYLDDQLKMAELKAMAQNSQYEVKRIAANEHCENQYVNGGYYER